MQPHSAHVCVLPSSSDSGTASLEWTHPKSKAIGFLGDQAFTHRC